MATKLAEALKPASYKTELHPDWCPGCGDFGIINAIQQTLAQMQLAPWDVYVISGVGCSGKTPHYIHTYGSHTLHGRALPYALGAKMANPKLTVIAAGGDGDGYGIGAGHFVHAGRRNIDLTYIVFDNEVYGLTKGQASPTLSQGEKPKSLPLPHISQGINPMALALASGYTFISQSYSYDAKHLKATLQAAIEHKGMSLVNVIQPCPTYNDLRTKEFMAEMVAENGFEVPRVYYLDEAGYNGKVDSPDDAQHVSLKRQEAFERMGRVEDRIPLGVFYQIQKPTYEDMLKTNLPLLREYAPVDLPYHDANMRPTTDLTSAWEDSVI